MTVREALEARTSTGTVRSALPRLVRLLLNRERVWVEHGWSEYVPYDGSTVKRYMVEDTMGWNAGHSLRVDRDRNRIELSGSFISPETVRIYDAQMGIIAYTVLQMCDGMAHIATTGGSQYIMRTLDLPIHTCDVWTCTWPAALGLQGEHLHRTAGGDYYRCDSSGCKLPPIRVDICSGDHHEGEPDEYADCRSSFARPDCLDMAESVLLPSHTPPPTPPSKGPPPTPTRPVKPPPSRLRARQVNRELSKKRRRRRLIGAVDKSTKDGYIPEGRDGNCVL